MNVLLADDDRLVLEGLEKTIDWAALDAQIVGMAGDGAEALLMARANRPDVVITDICMPGMDGLELVQSLREELDEVDIFLLSGHNEFEYAQRAMRLGVRHYILKPITRDTITGLERELTAVRDRLNAEKRQYGVLFSAEQEEALLLALTRGDTGALESAFDALERNALLPEKNTVTVCLWLLNIIRRHLRELSMGGEAAEHSHKSAVEEMLALQSRREKLFFVEQKFFDLAQSNQARGRNSHLRIALKARQLLEENYTDPDFCVSSLADRLGITSSYISTVFRRQEGVSISLYLSELRLEHARELLSATAQSISEIARISGYIDAHYFAKIFKKRYRLTPTEYRNLAAHGGQTP